jgi:hypothetical protein
MEKTLLETTIGVFQWTVAIGSVIGALALFTWIAVLFLKKDRKDESHGNRH